jgi:hypothetical protein
MLFLRLLFDPPKQSSPGGRLVVANLGKRQATRPRQRANLPNVDAQESSNPRRPESRARRSRTSSLAWRI